MADKGANPWYSIKVEDYENHMQHPDVAQMQMLNQIMRRQIESIPADERSGAVVAILGITNGNGLEHIKPLHIKKVIGIDINEEFLDCCRQRYHALGDALCLEQIDLVEEKDRAVEALKEADLIIANLLIEHIHLDRFVAIIGELPRHGQRISCVIQVNPDGAIVSASGYEHAFDEVLTIVEEADEKNLALRMGEIGCLLNTKTSYSLPNGKVFVRLDFGA